MTNLLSNAIRFTQTSTVKDIQIKVEVSRIPPTTEETCLRPLDHLDDLVPIAPGEKMPIYVYVSVRDSGPGLKPKDLELLVSVKYRWPLARPNFELQFQRFQKGTVSFQLANFLFN